jgi:hypothetical protein
LGSEFYKRKSRGSVIMIVQRRAQKGLASALIYA